MSFLTGTHAHLNECERTHRWLELKGWMLTITASLSFHFWEHLLSRSKSSPRKRRNFLVYARPSQLRVISLPASLPPFLIPPPPAILQCLETSLIALSRGRVLLSSSRKRPGMPLNILEYTEQPNNKDCSGPKCWRCSDGQSPAPVKRRGCSFELASCTWFVTRKAAGEADSHALPSSPDRPASYRTATTFQPGTNLGLSPLQEIHKGGDKNV